MVGTIRPETEQRIDSTDERRKARGHVDLAHAASDPTHRGIAQNSELTMFFRCDRSWARIAGRYHELETPVHFRTPRGLYCGIESCRPRADRYMLLIGAVGANRYRHRNGAYRTHCRRTECTASYTWGRNRARH